jgi:DNA-binding NarL/FixJ family response regulator
VFTGEIVPDGTWQPPAKGLKTTGMNNTNGVKKIPENEPKVKLTFRENQILELSAKGLAIKQIASELGISARTVEKHRANIMEKTQTKNMLESLYYFSNKEK